MAVLYRLAKSSIKKNGKEMNFAKAVSNGECHTDAIAKEMSRSGSITEGEAIGYIRDLMLLMKEKLGSGQTVVLDGFGRFKLAIESEQVENPKDFNADKNIKGVKCKFIAEGRKEIGNQKLVKTFSEGVKCVEAPFYEKTDDRVNG